MLIDIFTILLLYLATEVGKFEFALFALRGGTLSCNLVYPTSLKSIPDEIKTHSTFGLHLPACKI